MADDAEEVRCPCCRLFYPRRNPPLFAPHAVPLDPRAGVCWDCVHHQGDVETVKKARGKHHGKMLRREYDHMREQVAAARRELEDRPVRIVVRVENLDQEIVSAALAEVDNAYHRRDVAMGALSDLRLLHRRPNDNKSRCVCGKQYDKCNEAQIADGWDGIALWERTQAERAWLGEPHHLRRDHPAINDRQWFGDTYYKAG